MTLHSEQIHEVAAALAKTQGELENAAKNRENPAFHSGYADLASVLDACREPLSRNGLSVTQLPTADEGGMSLVTLLMHTSGQFLRSNYPIRPVKQDPQGVGSAISYARRYTLMAMVGLAAEDDDGNSASAPSPRAQGRPARNGHAAGNGNGAAKPPATRPAPGPSRTFDEVMRLVIEDWHAFDPIADGKERTAREHQLANGLVTIAVQDGHTTEGAVGKPSADGTKVVRDKAKAFAELKRLFAEQREWFSNSLSYYLDEKRAEAGVNLDA